MEYNRWMVTIYFPTGKQVSRSVLATAADGAIEVALNYYGLQYNPWISASAKQESGL